MLENSHITLKLLSCQFFIANKCFMRKFIQKHHSIVASSSTPETWAQFTHENIVHAERERMASINLRSLIDNVLNDTSNDMRHQCNLTNTALQQRIDEVNGAKVKLQNHLQKVVCSCFN